MVIAIDVPGCPETSRGAFDGEPQSRGEAEMEEFEGAGTRPQGRPSRGGREAGRDHLIESARGVMRARPKLDIQRREVAEHAGVTPALVSYYFPDKAVLLEIAAQPIIENYAADVRLILRSRTRPRNKLRQLISLFLTFNSDQGFILDHYFEVSFVKRRDSDVAILAAVKLELSVFFERLIALKVVKGDDPQFVPAALWGLCRYVGRRGEVDMFKDDEGFSAPPSVLADRVLELISA